MFKVMKHDANGQGIKVTQCGGPVKTEAKAHALRARMHAVQGVGGSYWYTIERA